MPETFNCETFLVNHQKFQTLQATLQHYKPEYVQDSEKVYETFTVDHYHNSVLSYVTLS